MIHVHEVGETVVNGQGVMLDLFRSKVSGSSEGVRIQDGACAEFKGLEALVCVGDVIAHEHHAVILHDDCLVVRILREFTGNLLSEQFAAWKSIRSKADGSADAEGLGKDAGVGNLLGDAECHESRRMCVDHAVKIRTDFV